MTTEDVLNALAAARDAMATKAGAQIVREIRALLARQDEAEADGESYAARVVARAHARAEGRVTSRPRRGLRGVR